MTRARYGGRARRILAPARRARRTRRRRGARAADPPGAVRVRVNGRAAGTFTAGPGVGRSPRGRVPRGVAAATSTTSSCEPGLRRGCGSTELQFLRAGVPTARSAGSRRDDRDERADPARGGDRRRSRGPEGRPRRASRAGAAVTLLESAPVLGGLASSFDVQGMRIERYYHFICKGDDDLQDTLAELGLGRKLRWRDSRMAYFVDGALYPFLTPLELLRFAPLGADRPRARGRRAEARATDARGGPGAAPRRRLADGAVRRARVPRDLGAAHALQVRRARARR